MGGPSKSGNDGRAWSRPSLTVDAIVERLTAELAHRYDPGAIKDCVKRCDAELDAATMASRPELLERLARQRLSNHEQSL